MPSFPAIPLAAKLLGVLALRLDKSPSSYSGSLLPKLGDFASAAFN